MERVGEFFGQHHFQRSGLGGEYDSDLVVGVFDPHRGQCRDAVVPEPLAGEVLRGLDRMRKRGASAQCQFQIFKQQRADASDAAMLSRDEIAVARAQALRRKIKRQRKNLVSDLAELLNQLREKGDRGF